MATMRPAEFVDRHNPLRRYNYVAVSTSSFGHVFPVTWKGKIMKNRIFMTLLLSTAFALAAFAQQSGSGAAPAATGPGGPQPASTHDFWDGDEPSLGALIFHPFATKEYVRRHVQPIRDRVSELDEITAANSRMIRDVDARAQQG